MAVNKVEFYGNTLIDISDTTAEESAVVAGEAFYKADGTRATGTADYQQKITTQTVSLSSSWSGSIIKRYLRAKPPVSKSTSIPLLTSWQHSQMLVLPRWWRQMKTER